MDKRRTGKSQGGDKGGRKQGKRVWMEGEERRGEGGGKAGEGKSRPHGYF